MATIPRRKIIESDSDSNREEELLDQAPAMALEGSWQDPSPIPNDDATAAAAFSGDEENHALSESFFASDTGPVPGAFYDSDGNEIKVVEKKRKPTKLDRAEAHMRAQKALRGLAGVLTIRCAWIRLTVELQFELPQRKSKLNMNKFLADRGIKREDALDRLNRSARKQEEKKKKEMEQAAAIRALSATMASTGSRSTAAPEPSRPIKSEDEIVSSLFEPEPLQQEGADDPALAAAALSADTPLPPAPEHLPAVQDPQPTEDISMLPDASPKPPKIDHLVPITRTGLDDSDGSDFEIQIVKPKTPVRKALFPHQIQESQKDNLNRQMLILAEQQIKERRERELEEKKNELEALKRRREEKKAARLREEQEIMEKERLAREQEALGRQDSAIHAVDDKAMPSASNPADAAMDQDTPDMDPTHPIQLEYHTDSDEYASRPNQSAPLLTVTTLIQRFLAWMLPLSTSTQTRQC
ncbi:hypothetical protein HDU91_005743 [Kappamyces sp. JEL0680]|nr:hypothetical protein HDU91_005743 [Kappamyces sp. JEL0680]